MDVTKTAELLSINEQNEMITHEIVARTVRVKRYNQDALIYNYFKPIANGGLIVEKGHGMWQTLHYFDEFWLWQTETYLNNLKKASTESELSY